MGARQSTPSERLNKFVKDSFNEKKADIKMQWNDPAGWEAKEKREREERSKRWWDMYQRDETKDPPPVALGRIKEAFTIKPIIKDDMIPMSDTEQAENNRRQNEAGGASLCKGEACNAPVKTLPIENPSE